MKRTDAPQGSSQHFYNSQDMEATYTSINRGMDKEDVGHTYDGMLLGHKKELM